MSLLMEPTAQSDIRHGPRGMGAILQALDAPFLREPNAKLAPLVNWSGPSEMPIHRWYRYREGFSPLLIEALQLGDRILDPFAGCGSILLGAAESGRSSVGIDVNPLAVFVAQVKLSPLTSREAASARRFLQDLEHRVAVAEPAPVPALKIAHKVFEPTIMDTLLRLETAIEAFQVSARVRDFLWLARLAILEAVGSYFKEGNGIKYRNRKRLSTGYVPRIEGKWQRERFGVDQKAYVLKCFSAMLSSMLEDVHVWKTPSATWAAQEMRAGSSVTELAELDAESFDSVVFSPPYANRFDYFESMKVELWFGRFVRTYDDMNRLRKQSLRSHLGSDLRVEERPVPEIDALLDLMSADSYATKGRVRDLVHGYFADMEAVLSGCRRVLKGGGECHIVVGNSAYAGVIVPTDVVLAKIGVEVGFNQAAVTPVRHLTVAPQQRNALNGHLSSMRESVVTLS